MERAFWKRNIDSYANEKFDCTLFSLNNARLQFTVYVQASTITAVTFPRFLQPLKGTKCFHVHMTPFLKNEIYIFQKTDGVV